MMREKEIEKAVAKYAKSLNWQTYKFSPENQIGVPDRIFLKNGQIIFIEFKCSVGKTTKMQDVVIKRLVKSGFQVYVVTSVNEGISIIDQFELDFLSN